MSKLLVNAQKESLKNTSGVHTSSRKPTKKYAMKMKGKNKEKKLCPRKNVINGRKPFIMPIRKAGEKNLHELQENDYGYNEGIICLVNS